MVCECHLISDPLYQHTWSCLHHYNYSEAIFTAERIFAENPNDEAIYLLATCLYRSNGPKQARNFILRQDCNSSKCRYLLAKCYMDIGNNSDAENTLLGVSQELENPSDVAAFYKDTAPFVLRMLADIFKQSERRKLAISYLKKCLELNPLLWSSFTDLVDLHDNVEAVDVFSLPKGVGLNNQSCLRALSNKINIGEIAHPNCPSKKRTDMHDSQEDLSVSRENVNPKFEEKFIDSVNSADLIHSTEEQISYSFSGVASHIHCNSVADHLCSNLLPECNIQTHIQSRQKIYAPKQIRNDIEEMEIEPSKPLFGNACLNSSSTVFGFEPVFNIRSSEQVDNVHFSQQSHIISPVSHQSYSHNTKKHRNSSKRMVFSSPKTIDTSTVIVAPKYEIPNPGLFSSPNLNPIIKTDNLNFSAIPSLPMSPVLVDQCRIVDTSPLIQTVDAGLQSMNCSDVKHSGPRTRSQVARAAAQKSSFKKEFMNVPGDFGHKSSTESDTRLQSVVYYLQLLISMGRAYKYMKNYKLSDAISQIKQLPKHHSETALVSSWLAKAYIEMNDKNQACIILSASFQNEPWQLHGVALFSAILWMLNKEKELLSLANDMLEMDRESPEVWCVYGNCMSLNKESEIALRFFQRVVQLNPSYSYGYMLLGHEYFSQDELDKALTSYRRALDLDSHNYSASYCIASVYQRQDNYVESEKILKEALKIFPDSYILLTNLAVVRSKLKHSFAPDAALELLEKACRLYPNEPLCRFHKASILYYNGRYHEALADLKLLDSVKEARIFLLMSMIFKQMGEMSKAMVYNTWAIELDPKCTNDSFMMDRNFCGGGGGSGSSCGIGAGVSGLGGTVTTGDQNNTTMASLNTSFLANNGRRNSESMQEDVTSNNTNHITYDLLETD